MSEFIGVNLKGFGKKYKGKVRDWYVRGEKRILITTDRISAFDRILGLIPYKGQVLNQLAAFWFEKTKDIIPNHVLEIPDPNVTIGRNCQPIPIEMVVRGYISGVTSTSIWGSYQKGERIIYGVSFPDDLKKNQKLPTPVITPTTKAKTGHDERLTKKEILKRRIVPKEIYEQMEEATLKLFDRGTKICEKAGIILVDTKYEFGVLNRKLILIDEIHTPDSSRFWIKKTYKERFRKDIEPENFDKEFMRLWYKNHGYLGNGKPPGMPLNLKEKTSKRYIKIYELITGKKFIKPKGSIAARIKKNIEKLPIRIAILVSNKGWGTNSRAIITAVKSGKLKAHIAVVVSTADHAPAYIFAKKNHIPTYVLGNEENLTDIFKEKFDADYIALAGWPRIIPKECMTMFSGKILNLHPGLIPDALKGVVKNPDGTKGLWNKWKLTDTAIQNFLDNKATYAGSSIHIVTNEPDFGKVLGRCFEKIKSSDTITTLYTRLKKKENALYVSVLKTLLKKQHL